MHTSIYLHEYMYAWITYVTCILCLSHSRRVPTTKPDLRRQKWAHAHMIESMTRIAKCIRHRKRKHTGNFWRQCLYTAPVHKDKIIMESLPYSITWTAYFILHLAYPGKGVAIFFSRIWNLPCGHLYHWANKSLLFGVVYFQIIVRTTKSWDAEIPSHIPFEMIGVEIK